MCFDFFQFNDNVTFLFNTGGGVKFIQGLNGTAYPCAAAFNGGIFELRQNCVTPGHSRTVGKCNICVKHAKNFHTPRSDGLRKIYTLYPDGLRENIRCVLTDCVKIYAYADFICAGCSPVRNPVYFDFNRFDTNCQGGGKSSGTMQICTC